MTDDARNPLVGKKTSSACGMQVLEKATDTLALWLGPDERFVVLMRNSPPIAIGHSEPGMYDIEGKDFVGETFPIAVMGMSVSDVERFKTMPFHVVNKIIAAIAKAIDDGSYELKPQTYNYKNSDETLQTFKFGAYQINRPKLVH